MEEPPQKPRAARYIEGRVEQKGLRPRFAAAVIASVWLVSIVVFGIIEHLVDPDSFDNIWLGMWWATQTVTTVGYGDAVPSETSGRVIAMVLMVGGLSMFAVVTATITSAFIARAQAERGSGRDAALQQKFDRVAAELKTVGEQLARLAPPERSPSEGDEHT